MIIQAAMRSRALRALLPLVICALLIYMSTFYGDVIALNSREEAPVENIDTVHTHLPAQRVQSVDQEEHDLTEDVVYLPDVNQSNFVQPGGLPSIYIPGAEYDRTNPLTKPSDDMFIDITGEEGVDQRISALEQGPLPTLPNYKNPCWFELVDPSNKDPYAHNIYHTFYKTDTRKSYLYKHFGNNKRVLAERAKKGEYWRLRCVPYFYIISVNRGSSTSFHGAIHQHPMMAHSTIKETQYWHVIRLGVAVENFGIYKHMPLIKHFPVPRKFSDYVDFYDDAAERIRTTVVQKDGHPYHPVITGDGTPTYLVDYDGWRNIPGNEGLDEPKYILAHILKQLTPQAKFIVLLRDPIDRLYSEYLAYFRFAQKSTAEFHRHVTTSVNAMNNCLKNRTVRSCIYDKAVSNQTVPVILRTGMYAAFLKDWLQVFSRDHFHFVRSEDFFDNAAEQVSATHRFLGLDPRSWTHKTGGKNQSPAKSKAIGGMLPETRQLLHSFYDEWNRQLAELLGDDKYLWNTPKL